MSRLSALCAMLCMVAVVVAGLGAAQSVVQVLQHQVAGDQQTSDGGWVATCVDEGGQCLGHLRADEPLPGDMLAVHHHHHNAGEVSQGLASGTQDFSVRLNLANANLQPVDALPMPGRNPALPYQPPRA